MAKSWIATTVIEKGAEGRRWLDATRGVGDCDQGEDKFSANNGALIVHMSGTRYSLQVLEVDSKRASTIWVGDGRTKIGAVFTGASAKCPGQSFVIRNFDIVIDPTKKPESRVTLRIGDFDIKDARPIAQMSTEEYVEHNSAVHKLVKILGAMGRPERRLSVYGSETTSSPMPSQADDLGSPLSPDENFGTQAAFSTQLPRTEFGLDTMLAPRPPLEMDQRRREKTDQASERHTHEEGPKKTNYLIAMAPALPRKASAMNTAAVQNPTTGKSRAERELVKHSDRGVPSTPHGLQLQTVPRSLSRDLADTTKVADPRQSRSPFRPAQDPTSDELAKTNVHDLERSREDLEFLGDSEKENNQQKFVDTTPGTRPDTGHAPVAVSTEYEMGGSYLKDDPWETMRKAQKIIPSWLEFPEDPTDVWVTPGLPETGPHERRTSLHLGKTSNQVAEERLEDSNNSSASRDVTLKNNASKNNSSSPDLWSDQDGDMPTVERQPDRPRHETTKVPSVEPEAVEVTENIADEVSRGAVESEDQGAIIDYVASGESRFRETSTAAELPRQIPQRSDALSSTQEESRLNVVQSNPSSRHSSPTSDEVLSWSPSPETDQTAAEKQVQAAEEQDQADEEPDTRELDEMVSVVPESSIPGSSLVVDKSLNSLDKNEASKAAVQIICSNPVDEEEEEEEEEMELAEPSALGQGLPVTEIVTQTTETAPSEEAPSSALQEPEMVEVERTPHLQTKSQAQTVEFDLSSDFVVPGTAEEENRQDEVHHMLPATRPPVDDNTKPTVQPSQSTAEKGATSPEEARIRTEPTNLKRNSLQADLSISPPPPKRLTLAKSRPLKFTPGTQSPVDLEELKKSYRREFLRGHTAAEQSSTFTGRLYDKSAQHEPTVDKSRRGEQTPVGTLGKDKAIQKQAINTAHSGKGEGENIKSSDLHMASSRDRQVSLPSEQPANIYDRYRLAYPTFTKSIHAFIRACVYIEWLTFQHLKPMLWDDFVHKFCHEYPIYVINSSNPVSAIKWYNEHENFTCGQRVLGRHNLKEVLALDPVETEKSRATIRRGANRESNQIIQASNQLQKSSTPVIQPSGSIDSNASSDVNIPSRSASGKKRILPWTPSPQPSVNDAVSVPHSKRPRYEEQDDFRNESTLEPSLSHPRKRQLGSEFRPRQASPELGSWRAIMPKSRSSTVAATRQDRQLNEVASSPAPRTPSPPSPPVQSPALGSVRPPRSRASENIRESVSRAGSRRSSSTAESVAELAKKWLKDPNRRRTTVNLTESEDG